MTTTVTIEAHVADDEEVSVKLTDNGETIEEFSLQNGEKCNFYVYDGREISVKEVKK